jgi:hypothetical protein
VAPLRPFCGISSRSRRRNQIDRRGRRGWCEQVQIRWPSGLVETKGLPADGFYTVREGQGITKNTLQD